MFFYNCGAQQVTQEDDCINIQGIQDVMINEIYRHKKHERLIGRKIITESSSGVELNAFLHSNAFQLMTKIDNNSVNDNINFTNFFSRDDLDYMRCQLETNKLKSWGEILNKDYYHLQRQLDCSKLNSWSNNEIFKSANQKNFKKKFSVSLPTFSKDGVYAFIYIETAYSGQLRVYKNINGKWSYFAEGLVWIS